MTILRTHRSLLPPTPNLSPILDDPKVKQGILPDRTHVWQSVHFDGQLKLSRTATLRGLYQTVKWLRKVNQSLDPVNDPTQWAYGRYASRWGQSMIAEGNLCLQVKGLEQLEEGAVYLFAPTHHSLLDTPLLYTALENWNLGFMAKKVFKYVPYLGKPMKRSGRHIFVDLNDPNSLKLAGLQAVKHLRKSGNPFSLVVFPEGSRSIGRKDSQGNRIDGYLITKDKKLHEGVADIFRLTASKGVRLVPVVINGTGRVLPKGSFHTQTGDTVEIIIGRPRSLSEFGDDGMKSRNQVKQNIMSDLEYFYAQNYREIHIEP